MVEGHEKSTFNLAQFSAIAAFSERLLFSETQWVNAYIATFFTSNKDGNKILDYPQTHLI